MYLCIYIYICIHINYISDYIIMEVYIYIYIFLYIQEYIYIYIHNDVITDIVYMYIYTIYNIQYTCALVVKHVRFCDQFLLMPVAGGFGGHKSVYPNSWMMLDGLYCKMP